MKRVLFAGLVCLFMTQISAYGQLKASSAHLPHLPEAGGSLTFRPLSLNVRINDANKAKAAMSSPHRRFPAQPLKARGGKHSASPLVTALYTLWQAISPRDGALN